MAECVLEALIVEVEGHGYDFDGIAGPFAEYIHLDGRESLDVVPESVALFVVEGPLPQVLHIVDLLPVQAVFLEAEVEGIREVLEPQHSQASDMTKASVHLFEQLALQPTEEVVHMLDQIVLALHV